MSPTRTELEAVRSRLLPDVLAPGLQVLFCGINPGLWSAATGHHFARPGNRFWPTLQRAGFTARRLRPEEQHELPVLGLGLTNVAARATARADELAREELVEGGRALRSRCAGSGPAGWRWWASVRTGTRSQRPGRWSVPSRRGWGDPGVGAAQPEQAQRPLVGGGPGDGVRPAPRRRRTARPDPVAARWWGGQPDRPLPRRTGGDAVRPAPRAGLRQGPGWLSRAGDPPP